MPTPNVSTAIRPRKAISLPVRSDMMVFKPLTLADIPNVRRLLQYAGSRTCDYTLGGIFMWIDYFKYEYCIVNDTLFIKGVSESDGHSTAFSLPIGAMSLKDAVGYLRKYCRSIGQPLRFSAIPEDRLDEFAAIGQLDITELTDWADYLYDPSSLATLSGKKLNKKRNHVNRFMAENPGARLRPLTSADVPNLKDCYRRWLEATGEQETPTAQQEHRQTLSVLDNLDTYRFEGAVLEDGHGKTVAFCLGEIIGDTLFTHIEKMDHRVTGAGETINKLYAEMMLDRHPYLKYINREEDCGDPGLRHAKQSYHPVALLQKFDITMV